MCRKNGCCNRTEEPKDDPKRCPPEQVKECHGDVEEHPCDTTDQPPKRKCCCGQ
jgi:hypothetical protein